MSQIQEKFLPTLSGGTPSDVAITSGDTYKTAFYKLQGQHNTLDGRTDVLEANVQGSSLIDLTAFTGTYNMTLAQSRCSVILFSNDDSSINDVNFYDTPDAPVQMAIFNCSSLSLNIRMSTADNIITLPPTAWTLVVYGYTLATIIAINATVADGDKGDVIVSSAGTVWELDAAASRTRLSINNVDNTSDADKPVSTAQGTAIGLKADKTITINGQGLSSNVTITATDVGLGNCDNTSDADKPVSTAQSTAIGLKADKTITINGQDLSANVTLTKSDVGLSNVPNTDCTDASNITSGVINIARLPLAAVPSLKVVADQTARFALTTADVQNGDTVKQTDTNLMYYVVDDSNLGNAAGYDVYDAAVDWSAITSIPAPVSALLGTNTGDQTITLTGNVTGVSTNTLGVTSLVTTIANSAVTLAKLANLAANSVIGNVTGAAAVPTAVGVSATAVTSSIVYRDANGVATIRRLVNGYVTVVTAAGTTTLTVASARDQFFTGTNTQTVVLPSCTTITIGSQFTINNNSTGLVTVNANGGGLVSTVLPGTSKLFICTSVATAAGVWSTRGMGGSVTAVTVATANGVSATVANQGTTPAFTFTLGAITPDSVTVPATGTVSVGTLGFSPAANTARIWYADTQNNFINAIIQNKSNGISASSDLTLSTDTGTDSVEWVDLGINCSGWTGTTYGAAKDAYLVNEGGASGVGNLLIGTSQANTKVKFSVGNGFLNSTAGILELTAAMAMVNGNFASTGGIVEGRATTVTAAGTTTLTVNSPYRQVFTGTTTQTVVLPDATTCLLGQKYRIRNQSTGVLTINANGGGNVCYVSPGAIHELVCSDNSSAAGIWDQYQVAGTPVLNYKTTTDYTVANTAYTAINAAVRLTPPAGTYLVLCVCQLTMTTNNDIDCWLGIHAGTSGSTTLVTGAENPVIPRQQTATFNNTDYSMANMVFGICTIANGQIIEPKIKSSTGTVQILNTTITALRIG